MTNYMICLSHFCELHGPSSVICTQITTSKLSNKLLLQNTSKLQTCMSCKLQLPNDKINLRTRNTSPKLSSAISSSGSEYVSTQYPAFQERYTSLSKLIMKTLSVETTSNLSKPLFVGDSVNGYSLSKIFKIKDVNARGGERKYSLMVLSDKEIKIMKNWDVITKYLTEMINSIQKKVSTVIAYREKTKNNTNETYLRRSLIKPKSLVELTGDHQIFVKLHLSAIQLMKDMS